MRLLTVAMLTIGVVSGAQAAPAGLGETPDPAGANLPANYSGNDLPLVIRRYETWAHQLSGTTRGEFETSAEYQVRRTAALNRDLDYGVPITRRFAFTFPTQLRYDADRQAFIGGILGEYSYRERELSPEPNPIFGTESYSTITGATSGPVKLMVPYQGRWGGSFMVEQSDTHTDGLTFCWRTRPTSSGSWTPPTPCRLSGDAAAFPMLRERAREIAPRLRIAVFGMIDRERTIVTGLHSGRTPEPSYAYHTTWRATYLPVIPSAAVIYDFQTGEIVHRINLSPPASASRNTRPARRQ